MLTRYKIKPKSASGRHSFIYFWHSYFQSVFMFTFSWHNPPFLQKSNENPFKIKQKYRLKTNNDLD